MKTIVLTGGGTAGHVMPNLALVPFLEKDFELHYIGRPGSMEEELVKKNCPQVIFHPVECVKFARKFTLKNLAVPFSLLSSKNKAKKILAEILPSAIFSKGGFVALPVMLAAGKIPLVLHESDYTMGLSNRMGAKKCNCVCTSFADLAAKINNGVCTGAPLRPQIYRGDKRRAESESGLSGRQNLLVMGGSLGAASVNEAVYAELDALTRRFDVVHLTGKQNAAPLKVPHYYPIPFTNHIEDYLAWADCCVSRGGANALFELTALAIPTLVIPLPKGVSRGDQVDNARYFEKMGCVKVLEQKKLADEKHSNGTKKLPLCIALDELQANRAALRTACGQAMNIDGTEKIARIIKEAAGNPRKTER